MYLVELDRDWWRTPKRTEGRYYPPGLIGITLVMT